MGTAGMRFGYGFMSGLFSGVYETSQGYQFNSHIYLGAHVGFYLDEGSFIPLGGADFRWFWSDDEWDTGYMGLKVGFPYLVDVTVGYRMGFFGLGASLGALGAMFAIEFFW